MIPGPPVEGRRQAPSFPHRRAAAEVLLQLLPAAAAILFVLVQARSALALAVLCGFSAICATFYVVRRSGLVSFCALFVLCFIGLYLLYPITSLLLGYQLPMDERISEYAFLTVGGLSLFLTAHAFGSRRMRSVKIPPLQASHVAMAFWLFLTPLIIALLLVASAWPSLPELIAATRLDIKETGSVPLLIAQYLWVVGTVGVVLGPLYLRGRYFAWIPFLALIAIAAVAGFLAFRTRSILLLLVTSLAMGLWLSRRVRVIRGKERRTGSESTVFRGPKLWRLAIVGLTVVVGISYVRIARGLFEERGFVGLSQVDLAQAMLTNLQRGDLAYAPIVFDVLAFVPERENYLWGQSYYRLLFTPVPRSVWPTKPANTQRIVASWLYPGKSQQTTPPSIQGDLFINFGYAGILGFLVYGYVFGLGDRWRGLGSVLAIGGGITPIFHLVRGGFTNPILLLFALLVAARAASAVAEGRVRLSARRPSLDAPNVA